MGIKFTDPQIQHLMEYGDKDWSDVEFVDSAERDKQFSKEMSRTESANDQGLKMLINNPHRHDLSELEAKIAEKLIARGFIEVRTPIIISTAALAKMTITPDHPLDSVAARQLFSSIGQIRLINYYSRLFSEYGIVVGQDYIEVEEKGDI